MTQEKQDIWFSQFLRDTPEHTLTVHLDQGSHRHLEWGKPGCGFYRIHIVTYPGYLCISGDMGSYVFRRLPDMFEFFRGSRINPSYWAEKLEAVDRMDGVTRFSPEKFREYIRESWEQYYEELDEYDRENRIDKYDMMRADLYTLSLDRDTEESAWDSLNDFERNWDSPGVFPQDDRLPVQEFTPRFIWCLHAIQAVVREYDRQKQNEADWGDLGISLTPVKYIPVVSRGGIELSGLGEFPIAQEAVQALKGAEMDRCDTGIVLEIADNRLRNLTAYTEEDIYGHP